MKRIIFAVLLLLSIGAHAQDQDFNKKDWKPFVSSFLENYEAAKTHFKGKYDVGLRDEMTGMPASSIPLHKSTRSFFDAATYSMFYSFELKEDQVESFFSIMGEKLEKGFGKDVKISLDEEFIAIENQTNPGEHPTVEVVLGASQVMITFYPAMDLELPTDF